MIEAGLFIKAASEKSLDDKITAGGRAV